MPTPRMVARLILIVLIFLTPSIIIASSEAAMEPDESPSLNSNPVGLGGVMAREGSGQPLRIGVLLEGSNHFRQRPGNLSIRQYGFAQSRGEWAGSFGLYLHASVGMTLMGLRPGERASLHLGVEPLGGRVQWRPGSPSRSFYQWHPMASAGGQLAWGSCRALGVLRLGGSLGNVHGTNLIPLLGASRGLLVSLNCDRVDLATELLRLEDRGGVAQFRAFDLTWNVPESQWKMGTRMEWRANAPGVSDDETRWMFVMRTNPLEE